MEQVSQPTDQAERRAQAIDPAELAALLRRTYRAGYEDARAEQ